MLVLKVELWPDGEKVGRRTIGAVEIGNLSDLAPVSDYVVRVMTGAESWEGVRGREAFVYGHDRSRSIWELIRRAMEAALDPVQFQPLPPDEVKRRLRRHGG